MFGDHLAKPRKLSYKDPHVLTSSRTPDQSHFRSTFDFVNIFNPFEEMLLNSIGLTMC